MSFEPLYFSYFASDMVHGLTKCKCDDSKSKKGKVLTGDFPRRPVPDVSSADLDVLDVLIAGRTAVEKKPLRGDILDDLRASKVAPLRRVARCADFAALLKD
mmetsp:Transcript_70306/g.197135  ORF Transcript_70306/g.197135 Transcript_70306/m.197135 type:complete len:102 (+) Transcript_70306:84-389(+)